MNNIQIGVGVIAMIIIGILIREILKLIGNNRGDCDNDSDKTTMVDNNYKTDLAVSEDSDAKIKMSSLSYANSAGRIGFDYEKFYNDFTNEGHIYPVHGVGDLDETKTLMKRFIQSSQGEAFRITDLGIKIKITDDSLTRPNSFFDFHNIPTKHLDGSTKLPDGTRIEQHIPYFNPMAEKDFPDSIAKIDWISGNARFDSCPSTWELQDKTLPTSLASTRETPFLEQDEHLALTFFMDGKQCRVNNGGNVSNWRYVVPGYMANIHWFVAKAWVEAESSDDGAVEITTTSGSKVWVRPRKESETDDLSKIAYNQNRYMQTVSKTVTITNGNDKMNSFNQRYGMKANNFGDIMMLDQPNNVFIDSFNQSSQIVDLFDKEFDEWVGSRNHEKKEKQIAFNEMITKAAEWLKDQDTDFVGPYRYVKNGTKSEKVWKYFRNRYLNLETYNISVTALNTKAQLPKSYIPTPVGETGWMIVESDHELPVPDDDGEYFIGWSIMTQPPNGELSNGENPVNGNKANTIRWCQTNGYAIHQGPGIIYLTGGDFPHVGTQEPYILKHNYCPKKLNEETESEFKNREKSQLPTVHWRLDKKEVIEKSLIIGNVTETNVGAGQKMLASIGTKTSIDLPSRSPNFLGRYYQDLLANPQDIQDLVGKNPGEGEVYKVVDIDEKVFIYGEEQYNGNKKPYKK